MDTSSSKKWLEIISTLHGNLVEDEPSQQVPKERANALGKEELIDNLNKLAKANGFILKGLELQEKQLGYGILEVSINPRPEEYFTYKDALSFCQQLNTCSDNKMYLPVSLSDFDNSVCRLNEAVLNCGL